MELELEQEGLRNRRDLYLFESLFNGCVIELRPSLCSIIILEYLIMIISDKFVRGLLQ